MEIPGWLPIQRAALVAAFVLATVAVLFLDRSSRRTGALRRRFLLGVPWGTLVTVGGVTAVYLFVQGGLDHWNSPVTLPFRAWSYFYPLGVLTAPFSHGGPGHLIGNLVGTLALAPLAEYAWSHFPRRRGSVSFGSWRTNPYVRAFVVFPAAAVGVGLLSGLFSIGPVIGFSAVVFAFAGVALVSYPLATVVALVVGDAVRLVYNALLSPEITASGRSAYITPWWADIAIQGHALGLLVGVLLGVAILRARGASERPSALRVWAGAVLFGFQQSMWAVYWFRGGETYVLYRAVGVALVVTAAVLVAYTVVASDRYLLRDAFGGAFAVRRWQAGAGCLLLVTALISGPAVPANLFTASEDELPGEELTVRDYEVTYAENVPNGMTSAVDVDAFGETTAVNTSGVIVRSEERGIWTTAVTRGRLDFAGRVPVRVGGLGWRDTVYAVRDGWVVAGGDTAYRVFLTHDGYSRIAHTSDAAAADPVVAGRNVSVEPAREGYYVRVTRDNETVAAAVPETGERVTLDNLTFVRQNRELYVEHEETRLRIAQRESYN